MAANAAVYEAVVMMAPEAGAAGADQLANELAGALRAAGASGLAIKNWGLQSLRSCGRVAKAWYIHVCFETISKLEVLAQFKAFVVCSRLVLRWGVYASSWAAAGLRPSFDAGAGFLKADDVSPRQQQLASSEWPSSFEALTPFGDQARSERVNSFASFVAGADESDCEADYDADGYASDEDDADSYWDRRTRRAYGGADDYAHRRERERANAADVGALDFKNLALLHSLLTERGGIPQRFATGFTRRKQKKLAREIKRCRHLGLLAGRDLVLELGADDA